MLGGPFPVMDHLDLFESETGAQFIRRWQQDKPRVRSGRSIADKVGVSPATVSVALNEESTRHAPWPLDKLDPLIELMRLSPDLSDFLWLLLRRDHAQHFRQRAELTLRIEAARTYRYGRKVESDELRLLSAWFHLVPFEMAHLGGLPDDPDWLGRQLIPGVPAAAVAEAITLCERGGLLRREEGRLVAVGDHIVSVPEDDEEIAAALSRAVKRLHQWYLRRGCEALEEFSTEQRYFSADTLLVPVTALPRLRERIKAFHAELLHEAKQLREAAEPVEEHRLEFVGIQSYPMSEPFRGRPTGSSGDHPPDEAP